VNGALKAVVAAISAALVILNTTLANGTWPLTPGDWQIIAAALISPLLVYFVPNMPPLLKMAAMRPAEALVPNVTPGHTDIMPNPLVTSEDHTATHQA
jgi:hypothetical protein